MTASPSRTALGVAMRRAAHQLLDRPPIFVDPLAIRILPAEAAERIRKEARGSLSFSSSPRLRAYLAIRSRLAEDLLAEAVARGVRQYVIVGAGLDTFAYRATGDLAGVRVFEVDQAATQQWKRERLHDAAIPEPATVRYIAADLAKEDLRAALAASGFDATRPAVFAWLGVSMYLTPPAVLTVLRSIASFVPGSRLVFDYNVALDHLSWLARWRTRRSERRVARLGEPWLSRFAPADLAAQLRAFGFGGATDWGRPELSARYLAGRTDRLRLGGAGRIVVADVASPP